MQSISTLQEFHPPAKVAPVVREVAEAAGRHEPYNARIRHERWVLDYEYNPCGRYRIGSPRDPWRPRDAMTAHLYPPGLVYWENTMKQTGLRHSAWMTFEEGEAAGLMQLIEPEMLYARFLDKEGQLGALLRTATEACRNEGEGAFWNVQALLCRAIDLLLRSEALEAETRRIQSEADAFAGVSFAEAVRRELRQRMSEKLTLTDVARSLHVSPSTLSHRYRRETGESVMATLLALRVDAARILIARGLALKAVAEHTGFSDAFHLSRMFKQKEGVSPRGYVRRMRGRGGD